MNPTALLLFGLGEAPPPLAEQTVLSPSLAAPDIILANGNRDAETSITEGGIVLSAASKATGKFYVECQIVQLSSAPGFAFGLHRGTSALTTYLGGNANGWASWVSSLNRRTYNNAVMANNITSTAPNTTLRSRMAANIGAGAVWLSYFGSSAWIGGGDPAAGTFPTYTFTPGGDPFHIALCPYHGQASPTSVRNRLRLILPTAWAFTPPSGFGVWEA